MMPLLRLALASAWNRRATLGLTVLSVALAVTMLLGVERARIATREAFDHSVSGTDLVVGARSNAVQLMLSAVFHLGDEGVAMRWSSFQTLAADPAVAWAVPLSLGDSHRGFAVLGTTRLYFEHLRYGQRKALVMAAGRRFADGVDGVFETVLGADVAQNLRYRIGQRVTLSHGTAAAAAEHADKPFTVVGILARTGTPVDRTLHVNLAGIEALHLDWQGGAPVPGLAIPPEFVGKFDLAPKQISAVLVGLRDRAHVFTLQREIEQHPSEALSAVLPGVALDQLWQVVGVVEQTLLGVSAMVVVVGFAGMVSVVLASLNERRRELSILRSVGAGPWHIAALLVTESVVLTIAGALTGIVILAALALLAGPWLEAHAGFSLRAGIASDGEWWLLSGVLTAGIVAGTLPAWRAARLALADGLTPKL